MIFLDFFFNDAATTEIYTYGHTLSLHDALPICGGAGAEQGNGAVEGDDGNRAHQQALVDGLEGKLAKRSLAQTRQAGDRKSTRLNSSHSCASRMPSSA